MEALQRDGDLTAEPLHVPIMGEGSEPLGVINARDALPALLEGSEHEESLLRDYVMGIGYR